MSETGAIAGLDGISTYKESTRTPNNDLGKDAFLNLMITQMRYQDPLQPMSNTESIAQLAQFSALEQMTNVAVAQQKNGAYSLIGKAVIGNLYSDATGITEQVGGVVTSVRQSGSDIFLKIGDMEIPFSSVTDVADPNSTALQALNANIATNQSLALIGKNVQAVMLNDKGEITKFVEGTVDYVKIANGRTILMIDDQEIFAEEVLLVSDKKKLIGKEATGVAVDKDGNETTTTGTIKGITFTDGKPYLQIGSEKFAIDSISDVTEGLNLIGKNVDTKDVSGEATGITIKNGTVYVNVGDETVSIETIKKYMYSGEEKAEESAESGKDESSESEDDGEEGTEV